jgi:hypothetical protein
MPEAFLLHAILFGFVIGVLIHHGVTAWQLCKKSDN